MKKFLFVPFLFLGGYIFAATPVAIYPGLPESNYAVTHSTVAISSTTVSTDAAVYGYRAVYLANLSSASTIYYSMDGTTTTLTTVGWPIYPRTPGFPVRVEKIEYNGVISYRLGAGSVGSIDVTKKIIRK